MKTDTAQMRQVASNFNNLASDLDNNMRALGRAADHAAGDWKGAAGAAFHNASGEVSVAWSHLNAVLMEISNTISVQGQGYGSTDHDNASNLNKIETTGITAGLAFGA